MEITNLHIFPTNINNQTRLFKEIEFTTSRNIIDRVIVLGLCYDEQPVYETHSAGIEVLRIKVLIRYFRRNLFFGRFSLIRKFIAAISFLQYCCIALVQAKKLKPHFISCHYVTMLPLCWAAAKISGATLEYLPHELETQRSGLTGIQKKIDAWLERLFIHSARNVVVVCDPIRDWYQETYGLTNLLVVRNVPEQDAVQVREIPKGGLRQQFAIPDSARVFIYQGLFSPGRGIETLIEAFKRLDPVKSHIVFMGYGDDFSQTSIDNASAMFPNIHFQPAVPREWIISYSHSADIGLWISETATLSYRYALPNKFFEYAHAGIPMLVSDNLEYQADLLTKGGFGWATPLDQLEQTLTKLSEVDLSPFVAKARDYAAAAVWEEDAKAFATVYRRAEG
jgi:glycosyltransferase involved in cell wall biosynthesis